VCQEFDIENEIIPQIAFFFGGGFGNTGAVCGAVCGAMMALGLKIERPTTMDQAIPTLGVAAKFRRRFEAEMGTIHCRELTGADLSTEEGLEQYMSSDVPMRVCFPAVGLAYRLVIDLLKESSQEQPIPSA
jgi:C_GCAxxG_C_C family probable redox protein